MRPLVFCWLCMLTTSAAYAQWPEQDSRPREASVPPFRAAWTNGERTVARLAGWDRSAPALELQDGPLHRAEKSVRWLRSTRPTSRPAMASGAYFLGGDFLPGVVVGLSRAAERAAVLGEPLLAVETPAAANPHEPLLDVRASWIKKIVWQPRGTDDFQPNTAFLRDGQSRSFHSLRWTSDAVRLLEEDKVEVLAIADLAELHLADQDAWSTYLRLLADLSPDCRARVVQMESATGCRLTTSSQRLRPWLAGNQPAEKHVVCVVQPPWVSDGLCLPLAEVRQLLFFEPQEIPLTQFAPLRHHHRGFALAGELPWRRNMAVLGTALFSGDREYAWGFGVQAQQTLEFALPGAATRVQTAVGIDRQADLRGAARGRLESVAGAAATSAPLLGSQQPVERLELALPRAGTESMVRLIADPLIDDRPPLADPLEIGDYVDWLEPLVIIERRQLAAAVKQQWPTSIPALTGWSLDGDWQPLSQWRPAERPRPGFRREIILFGEPLRMTQSLAITSERNHLVIHANRLAGQSAPIELRLIVDGQQQAMRNIPFDEQIDDSVAMVADLSAFVGRRAQIELQFRSRRQSASFEIRSIDLEGPPQRAGN